MIAWIEEVAHLVECSPSMHRALNLIPILYKPDINQKPGTCLESQHSVGRAGGSEFPDHPWCYTVIVKLVWAT